MMTSMSVAYSLTFNPVRHKPKYLPTESLQISFCQIILETDPTRCFILIVMSVGHCFSVSSPLRITNSLHHETLENWLYSIVDGNSSNDFFHNDCNACLIFSKPWPFRTRTEFSPQSFCQTLLGTDQIRLFMMISISLVHSLSFSSLRHTPNSVYYVFRKLHLFNSFRKQLKSLV